MLNLEDRVCAIHALLVARVKVVANAAFVVVGVEDAEAGGPGSDIALIRGRPVPV